MLGILLNFHLLDFARLLNNELYYTAGLGPLLLPEKQVKERGGRRGRGAYERYIKSATLVLLLDGSPLSLDALLTAGTKFYFYQNHLV